MSTQGRKTTKTNGKTVDFAKLGYHPDGTPITPVTEETPIAEKIATSTASAVSGAAKASRKAIGDVIDAELKDETHENPLSNLVKSLFSVLRGKSVRHGDSKENFGRFLQENKKNLVKIVVLVCCVLVVAGAAIWFVRHDNVYKIDKETVQYYAGQRFVLEDGTTLTRGLEEKTTLSDGQGQSDEQELTSLVFYQEEADTIVVPQDMVYYDMRTVMLKRIDALSEIICDKNVVVQKDNKNATLNQGFLYDGNDYYVFLEEVTLTFGGSSMTLSPMSYVEAVYQNYLVVFDYETKESIVQETPNTVVATAHDDAYRINLVNDSMSKKEDEKILLFGRADLLDSIFE